MFDFLRTHLIGIFEDNIGLISQAYLERSHEAASLTHPLTPQSHYPLSNQPFTWDLYFFLTSFFDPVVVYNLFLLMGIFLTFIAAFLFFRQYFKSRMLALGLTTIFTFSPYFYYQSRSHLDLSQVWVLLFFILALQRAQHLRDFFLLGLLLTTVFGVSNYLGYFALLFTALYFISKEVTFRLQDLFFITKREIKGFFVTLITFLITSSIFLGPNIMNNYGGFLQDLFHKDTKPQPATTKIFDTFTVGDSWKLQPQKTTQETPSKAFKRPLEDFFTFTSRPWYYLLPSVDNPFFGGITRKFIDWLKNQRHYWLAQNYFPSEHSASYLGWVNLILAFLGIKTVIRSLKKKKQRHRDITQELEVISFLGLIIGLFLLTMPPYITIKTHIIFLPSYLLMRIFPMFRTLARLGALILLCLLIFTGYGFQALLDPLKDNPTKSHSFSAHILRQLWLRVAFTFMPLLFLLDLAEFFIPIKISQVSNPPPMYSYIKEQTPPQSILAVYPYGKSREALFWRKEYQRILINPRDFKNEAFGFDAEEFTQNLTTCKGILEAKNLQTTYILFFPEISNDKEKKKAINFFETTPLLSQEKELDNGVLHKIRPDLNYENEKRKCLIP